MYHGLELSHQLIFGNDVKSYTDLVWWVNAVKGTNPGLYIDFDLQQADSIDFLFALELVKRVINFVVR